MSKLKEDAINLHRALRGKIEIHNRVSIDAGFGEEKGTLGLIHTPGVASVTEEISKNKELIYDYTSKWNNVAIVCDGTRVLGLGNIGPEGALPVMEGKSVLGDINAIPLCISTHVIRLHTSPKYLKQQLHWLSGGHGTHQHIQYLHPKNLVRHNRHWPHRVGLHNICNILLYTTIRLSHTPSDSKNILPRMLLVRILLFALSLNHQIKNIVIPVFVVLYIVPTKL
ncbi:MAG: hypothetical protein WA667_21395 [Candidatus Nitrosopolaris sp.]